MQELIVVTRIFSGIENILTTKHWDHSGSPAYYHFIRKLDLREDINYNLFLLSPKLIGNNRKKTLEFDNLNVVANIVPYYSILFSKHSLFLGKIEVFYNKLIQYIFILYKTYKIKNYYIDRDNILLTFILLVISRSNIVVTRLLGVPESVFQHLTHRNNIYSRIIKWTFSNKRAYFFCTNDGSYAEKVSNKFNSDRFYLLFNGVDKDLMPELNIDRNNKYPEIINIAYVSRIEPGKGHITFIEVLNKMRAIDNIIVHMIGDGRLKNKCKKLVKKYGLCDTVLFPGLLSHDKTVDCISNSDLFVSINYDGSFGNGVLEAATLGIPVVTLQHKSFLSNKYHQFFKFIENCENIEGDLVKFLEDFMRNRLLRHTMSISSIEFSNRYLVSWDNRIDVEIDIMTSIYNG